MPWLDVPASYAVTARWSRGAGLPHPLPDGLGLALRVEEAGGPGHPLDLLLTTGGRGRWTRHLPLPRASATAGPYSTLLPYVVGRRRGVVAAFPAPGTARIPARAASVRAAVVRRPVAFQLCFGTGGSWRALARLTLHEDTSRPLLNGEGFDPYLHYLPDFHPVDRLRSLRLAAYAGSRAGRHAEPPSRGKPGAEGPAGHP
ncbi:phosphodiesterase [Streptomyces cinereoruber]|uniref:phosphodiesterase n=1 Tax=Streptomyces cinereoruber TaxID=67260 RepID=UPI003EBA9C22